MGSESNLRVRSALAACLLLVACGGGGSGGGPTGGSPTPTSTPTPTPTDLSLATLRQTVAPAGFDYSRMMPTAASVTAVSGFNGRLIASEAAIASSINPAQETRFDPATSALRSPAFSTDFATDVDDIIPANRDIQTPRPGTGSYWDVILGAGRVWRDAADEEGWSRASLPLTLTSRREGQARNCVLLFAYSSSSVTNGYLQCSQDDSPTGYASGELRAMIPLRAEFGSSASAASFIADYRRIEAARLPVRPWNDLPHPDPASLQALFNGPAKPITVQSFAAIAVDGTIYAQDPLTIRGKYPYPQQMRHGVHSVTKGMTGGLSMYALAQIYGDAIFDAKVTDYVPELAGSGWNGVTFANALDMVSGTNGGEDERVVPWIMANSVVQELQAIASLGDAAPAPGASFNYATTNYFVLSVAMQRYVEALDPGQDYWEVVRESVLRPMGADDLQLQRSIEAGGTFGLPHLGIGAFPTADEAIKIAMLVRDEGKWNGTQLVSSSRTREALGKDGWQGYSAYDDARWRHGFLIYNFSKSSGCSFEVSSWQGLGGNYVTIMPSGLIFVRFIDNHDYLLSPMVSAVERLKPSC